MRNIYFLLALLCSLVFSFHCASEEMLRVRAMELHDVDLSKIKDGVYEGTYNYGSFQYIVKTSVSKHKINKIDIVQNRDTYYAKKAEGVAAKVILSQTPKVDAISGATTTSKALLKAIENSLTKGTGK